MSKPSKNIERAYELLTDTSLLHESEQCNVQSVCRGLANSVAPNAAAMDATQIECWARAISDLTLDRTGAETAIKLGTLQSIINFLKRYKSNEDLNKIADVSWSDVLIATHNFALLEDKGFPEALDLISQADLRSLADNLCHALKPGGYPSDARDAAARLSMYDVMSGPLMDSGIVAALANFIPSVKPLNRIPPNLWGPEALREINHSLTALDQLCFVYSKKDREDELPAKDLSSAALTGWICDVLHGANASDPKLQEDIEASKIAALDALTALLVNAAICRAAIPNNRSMLFRVASSVTGTSSVTLLAAAAQVLAQALSEADVVPPSELASLHTYDLVRHLSQVLLQSRDFREHLNILASLQNILDPEHFKSNIAAMKKAAERLIACEFESLLDSWMKNPRAHFDIPPKLQGSDPSPTEEDYEAMVEAGNGALENTRAILKAVGPITVPVIPRVPLPAKAVYIQEGPSGGAKGKGFKDEGATKRKATGEAEDAGQRKKAVQQAPPPPSSDGGLPPADRVSLEKDMRKAAGIASPLLSAPPFRAVLDWFNEWAFPDKLETELGTDIHIEGGSHRRLLREAIEKGDSKACLEILSDILQVKLAVSKAPPLAPAAPTPAPAPVPVAVPPVAPAPPPAPATAPTPPAPPATTPAPPAPAPPAPPAPAPPAPAPAPSAPPAPAPPAPAPAPPVPAPAPVPVPVAAAPPPPPPLAEPTAPPPPPPLA